jgi:sodium transport system permease protein
MRPKIIWTIFRKEIVDSLRDRLTLLVVLGLPILLYPLLIIGMSKLVDTQVAEQQMRASKVALWGEMPAALTNSLAKGTNLDVLLWAGAPETLRKDFEAGKLQPLPPESKTNAAKAKSNTANRLGVSDVELEPENPVLAAAREAITRRDVDAVLVVWPGFAQAMGQGTLGKASVYYDSVRLGSGAAQQRVWNALSDFRNTELRSREQGRGLPEGFTKAVEIGARNVAVQTRRSGQLIGSFLPFFLIMLSAVGALNAAIDLTAGEKDRNTMQTLLCSPVSATEIVAGKFFAVWSISLVAALANTSSLAATFTRIASATGLSSVPLVTHLWTFLLLLPATFTVAALFIGVAALARDAKDAGNFLGPTMLLLIGPLAAGMTPGMELNAGTAFVPMLNLTLLIKSLYISEAKPEFILLTLVSSCVYAALALFFAARVFGREQVLLGGKESVRAVFKIDRKEGALPTPAFAFISFALVLVVTFYASRWLENAGLIALILITQYGFFFLPTWGLSIGMKFSLKETFSLRRPPWQGLLAALLMGLSAWTVIAGLVIRILPPPDSLVKAMEKILLLDNAAMPLWVVLLLLAVTPAICEESLFRGVIMSGLRRMGKWPAIGISALLFAVAHASIYRLLPTLLLGILMGYLVWRTGSIYCSMLFHAVNNGLMATLVHYESTFKGMGAVETTFLPWHFTLVGGVVLVIGLIVLRFAPTRESMTLAQTKSPASL